MKVTLPDGTQGELEDREIVEETSPWSTIKLDDGTVLKIRLDITSVKRILEHWDAMSGDPSYWIGHKISVRTKAPKKLQAKEIHKTDTQAAKEVS